MSWKCLNVCSVFLQLCSCFWDAQMIFLWKNSIITWVVWLHVNYIPALLFSCLLTLSYLLLFWINLLYVKSRIYHCICSDVDFIIMWNSICYYTRIVCVPAYAFEQARIRCFFFLLIFSPLLQDSWRRVISTGVQIGIPMPCFTTALSFYDGYRHEMLPANLVQVGAWNSVVYHLFTEISSCCCLSTDLRTMMAVSHTPPL